MTVPYLMNCAHRQDGWGIDCVAKLGNEIWEAQEQCRALAASNLEWIKANGPNGWIENLRSELASEKIKRECAERRLAEALKDAERYQTARCMNVRQWQDARLLNTRTGKPFDEIIDDLRPFMRAAIDAATTRLI